MPPSSAGWFLYYIGTNAVVRLSLLEGVMRCKRRKSGQFSVRASVNPTRTLENSFAQRRGTEGDQTWGSIAEKGEDKMSEIFEERSIPRDNNACLPVVRRILAENPNRSFPQILREFVRIWGLPGDMEDPFWDVREPSNTHGGVMRTRRTLIDNRVRLAVRKIRGNR